MSFRIRRILVALRDERHVSRAQLRKAAAIARSSGARIELFHAINEPQALDSLRRGSIAGQPVRQIIDAAAERAEKRLARLAALKDFKGLKVTSAASWDFPPHEAVIRRAHAIDADLVVAAVQPSSAGARLLLANTDWELIRHCPCPVLIVKTARAWRRPAVIAAVDPFHTHDKPAALDRRILEAARYVARELRGSLHAFHAFMPMTIVAPAPAGQALAFNASPELEEIHTQQVMDAFDRVAARFEVPPRRRHLRMGVIHDELAATIKEVDAGIVVMGAVSRSGFRRFLIGSTAERILDRLDSDVLIIKPREFRARIPRRKSLAWLEG
ncbi:MAG: universal stress protein [Gammaproteobacteria bacterium]